MYLLFRVIELNTNIPQTHCTKFINFGWRGEGRRKEEMAPNLFSLSWMYMILDKLFILAKLFRDMFQHEIL